MTPEPTTADAKTAQGTLDAHVRDIVRWHFSPDTGTPHWIDFARDAGWDPIEEIQGFPDLISRFDNFDDEHLRKDPHEPNHPSYRVLLPHPLS